MSRTGKRRTRGGIPVRVAPGFWLLAAWFAAVNGWRLLAMILSGALLHEAGHLAALRLCGARITGFRVGVCGAVLETDREGLSYGQEMLCVLAGPAVNLLAAYLLSRQGNLVLTGVHLTLCAFNLLPIRPLDGGRALELAVSWAFGPAAGAAALAGAIGYVVWRSGGSLWLLPAMAGLLASSLRACTGQEP